MIHVIGLCRATLPYQPFISDVGQNVPLTNNSTNSTGNVLCTISWEPLRSASTRPRPPMPSARSTAVIMMTAALATPPLIVTPKAISSTMINPAWNPAKMADPAMRPTRIDTRDTGEVTRRSKNPFSMSFASSAAPPVAPKATAWSTLAGNTKSR